MKNRKLMLFILIFVLVLFYVFICYDLIRHDNGSQPTTGDMIKRMLYSGVWGVLLLAISHYVQERRRIVKKALKYVGLWCAMISAIMIVLLLSGVVQF